MPKVAALVALDNAEKGLPQAVPYSKRITDVVLASALLISTLPLMLLVALAIKCDSAGPVFYRQERVGLRGRHFTVLKFRSMRNDAEADGRPVWAATQDPRITRVGRFIRWVRIDELPQLLNVLRGEMSIVGPRPERPHFVEQFNKLIPLYDDRHAVLPGITGWAQISYSYGASLEDAREKLRYDLYYVANWSFELDLKILLATVGVVLSGKGAR
jgi:exopolysaccharide biosynthesis polyprenyl glycosylphosphotransferase